MQLSTILRNSSGLMLLAGLAYAALPTGNPSPNGEASRAAFERFKAMAGEWVELDAEGHKQEQVVSTFRTTAGGSAVLEVIFEGTEEEMVTVYHMEGDDLVLTHYCMLGNAPHMVMQPSEDPDIVQFVCQGGSNVECAVSEHMHSGRYEFDSEGGVLTAWSLMNEGEEVMLEESHMVRK